MQTYSKISFILLCSLYDVSTNTLRYSPAFFKGVQSLDDLHVYQDICEGKVKTLIIQIFVCVILYSFIESTCGRGRLYSDGFLFVSFFFFTFVHNKMYYAERIILDLSPLNFIMALQNTVIIIAPYLTSHRETFLLFKCARNLRNRYYSVDFQFPLWRTVQVQPSCNAWLQLLQHMPAGCLPHSGAWALK